MESLANDSIIRRIVIWNAKPSRALFVHSAGTAKRAGGTITSGSRPLKATRPAPRCNLVVATVYCSTCLHRLCKPMFFWLYACWGDMMMMVMSTAVRVERLHAERRGQNQIKIAGCFFSAFIIHVHVLSSSDLPQRRNRPVVYSSSGIYFLPGLSKHSKTSSVVTSKLKNKLPEI
ncbi:unnamed protein product [Ectocarpus fasciculatus]